MAFSFVLSGCLKMPDFSHQSHLGTWVYVYLVGISSLMYGVWVSDLYDSLTDLFIQQSHSSFIFYSIRDSPNPKVLPLTNLSSRTESHSGVPYSTQLSPKLRTLKDHCLPVSTASVSQAASGKDLNRRCH